MQKKNIERIPRSNWMRSLQQVSVTDIKEIIDSAILKYSVSFKSLPKSGLGVLQIQDTALQEAYFLGEFPVAMSWVVLTDDQGKSFEGAAQLMTDDENIASLFAVCDAILANNLLGAELLMALLESGEVKFQQQIMTRKAMLGSTAVDFSLLSTASHQVEAEEPKHD